MNQETKRAPGRPKTQAPKVAETTKATRKPIKRSEEKSKTAEYKAIGSGAVMMLIQTGVTVYDKETDSIREIRYCESENSIYKDEQSERSVKSPIVFRLGRLFVGQDKPNLRRFLEVHPGNKANGGNKFQLVDEEVKKSIEIDDEFLVHDAISLLRSKPVDDLLSVCLAFGINIDRPMAEIKHDLLIKAKSSPKVFIDSFDNPYVSMKSLIRQAESYQIIALNERSVSWFDTNKQIISVPAGQDPIDVFARYCMTEAAVPVVSEIERQLG